MQVSRIVSAWLADLIAMADDPIPGLIVSLTDGDEAPPDKISIVWSETVSPVAPPLHLYDLEYEIRTPQGCDLTMSHHASVEEWLREQLDDEDNYAALAIELEGIGTLNDWFTGVAGTVERNADFFVTLREIRLALVHN